MLICSLVQYVHCRLILDRLIQGLTATRRPAQTHTATGSGDAEPLICPSGNPLLLALWLAKETVCDQPLYRLIFKG